ncbi:MAG TPA: hypothetical protein VKV20_10765 [Ktedonobacteraceae bacterium]|nr:hypothetical protein [Ktedonobacteraceae bacterium]
MEQPTERQDDKGLLLPVPQPGQPGGIMVRLFQPPQGNRADRSSHLVSIDRVDQLESAMHHPEIPFPHGCATHVWPDRGQHHLLVPTAIRPGRV